MDTEKQLADQFKEYQELGAQNKNVDVGALMLNALDKHQSNSISPKQKRWAYLISLGVPPLGLLFALKFFLGDEDDARSTALVCVILTIVSIALAVVLFQAALSSSGTSVEQIQQIKPQDYQQLLQ